MISANDLEQFPIFSGLEHSLLTKIAQFCAKRTYRVGEVCITEGAQAEYLFLLLKGGINLERKLPENWLPPGTEGHNVVYSLQEKEIFGWASMIDTGGHLATARCSQDSELILIKGKQLLNELDNNCAAAYPFMKRLARIIALRLVATSDFLMREMANFKAYRSM
jgi:CRP-like cAMP-binding protein